MLEDNPCAGPELDTSGLKWVQNGIWGLEPRWAVEPDAEAVRQTTASSLDLGAVGSTIEFLAQGGFNKVYVVSFPETQQEVIARVALPVHPRWKTLSEVATLRWARDNTSLPVPEVLSYQADRASAVGFEWIVMSQMAGNSLRDRWRDVSFPAKEAIVRQLAAFCAETFNHQFRGIGNLYSEDIGPVPASSTSMSSISVKDQGPFCVRRIVSGEFMYSTRIHAQVPRGPFRSSREWLLARLSMAELSCREQLSRITKTTPETKGPGNDGDDNNDGQPGERKGVSNPTEGDGSNKEDENENENEDDDGKEDENESVDEDDLEDLQNTLDIITRLRLQLDNFFPPPDLSAETELERTMIHHDDLTGGNILVDDVGNLTAVLDWEGISVVPLWSACDFPPLLEGKHRDIEPVMAKYQHDEEGKANELFWEHLQDYELTQLRRAFLAEMKTLQPEWVAIFESSKRQMDFSFALACSDDGFTTGRIQEWLDDLEKGEPGFEGLLERIENTQRRMDGYD
ncbi:phosphotransferase enzyme family-domain-containing protein [Dichotomopilus funicola]|uniref:Phosphotransferase enzyme family-domain-containing protein n=1 Tax=Dichotomopilus funicola TaxID=1934379 RepID=A0AAN6V0Y2_9PEZI|nr:phosphotransferase enzyme family-domain-containing protein [Dichotomopilus funicola]